MMIMTNDDNSEGLFSIVQAKITVLESETKKTREPNNTINQSINQSVFISALDTYRKVMKS